MTFPSGWEQSFVLSTRHFLKVLAGGRRARSDRARRAGRCCASPRRPSNRRAREEPSGWRRDREGRGNVAIFDRVGSAADLAAGARRLARRPGRPCGGGSGGSADRRSSNCRWPRRCCSGLMKQGVTKYLAIFGHGSTALAELLRIYERRGPRALLAVPQRGGDGRTPRPRSPGSMARCRRSSPRSAPAPCRRWRARSRPPPTASASITSTATRRRTAKATTCSRSRGRARGCSVR